ncbi:hypothetical protein J6590_080634 [Homalodisca vitripennis]|nr:hypothetical protein J6590_080634 [Homalodisca vitripennis]
MLDFEPNCHTSHSTPMNTLRLVIYQHYPRPETSCVGISNDFTVRHRNSSILFSIGLKDGRRILPNHRTVDPEEDLMRSLVLKDHTYCSSVSNPQHRSQTLQPVVSSLPHNMARATLSGKHLLNCRYTPSAEKTLSRMCPRSSETSSENHLSGKFSKTKANLYSIKTFPKVSSNPSSVEGAVWQPACF